jgi:hypothetical protein
MEPALKERQKLSRLTAKKYRQTSRREKAKTPDTFTARIGCGRKYAIHALANEIRARPAGKRLRLKTARSTGGKLSAPFLRANTGVTIRPGGVPIL